MKKTLLFFIAVSLSGIVMADQTKFGHFQYKEAKKEDLVPAGSYSNGKIIYLQRGAYESYQKLRSAALRDGIKLKIISGFRSVSYQKYIYDRAIKRRGSVQKAAKVVAPPGYSQHHTGFAIDLGDSDDPKTDLSVTFEKTKAYSWLTRHAAEFQFYLSFKKNNPQGITFEPWHWYYKE